MSRGARDGMLALTDALRARGGTLADSLGEAPASGAAPEPGTPQLAASGPRAAGREAEYELLLEMIFEGSLLHYGSARVRATTIPTWPCCSAISSTRSACRAWPSSATSTRWPSWPT